MDEYIERTKICEEFQSRFDWLHSNAEMRTTFGVVKDPELTAAAMIMKECLDRVKREPTINIEPVEPVRHACWHEFRLGRYHWCSECERNAPYDRSGNEILPLWCPHCGAKMVIEKRPHFDEKGI